MGRRVRGLALTAVPALAVLVTGHNLVFLLTYGADYGVALMRTGHDARWGETVQAVLIAAGSLAAVAILRIAYLARLIRRLRPDDSGRLPARAFLRILAPVWIKVFTIAVTLFVLQENYERWSLGIGLPGISVLASFGVAGPVLVFLIVSLVVSAVTALFVFGITELETRIAACRSRNRAAAVSPTGGHRTVPLRLAASILGRNLAGRAPPCLSRAQ